MQLASIIVKRCPIRTIINHSSLSSPSGLKLNPATIACSFDQVPKRFNTNKRNYDKPKKLQPRDVTYRYDDSQFLPGPSFADEPYIKPTDDEIVELNRIKLDFEIKKQTWTEVDQNVAPFNQVLEGVPDEEGKFTGVERVSNDQSLWFWVDRLMPKPVLPPLPEDLPYDSLIVPIQSNKPDRPYFVARTRSRLFPLYRVYQIQGRTKKYWQNRWDGLYNKYHTDILQNMDEIKFENNEKTVTITKLGRIQGDIWALEADCRRHLEKSRNIDPETGLNRDTGERILSSVDEASGKILFQGDFVTELYTFLKDSGF